MASQQGPRGLGKDCQFHFKFWGLKIPSLCDRDLSSGSSLYLFCVALGWVLLIPPGKWVVTRWHQFVLDGVGSSESVVSSEDLEQSSPSCKFFGRLNLFKVRVNFQQKKEGGRVYIF